MQDLSAKNARTNDGDRGHCSCGEMGPAPGRFERSKDMFEVKIKSGSGIWI